MARPLVNAIDDRVGTGEEPPAPERAVPALASGDAPVMIIVAIGVALVAAWEILDGFRQAHRQRALPQAVGT